MHLFSSYMDTQLEAPLDKPEARTFTSRYMAKTGTDLPRNKGPVIVCQTVNPPNYCLALTGDSLPVDLEEIPRVNFIFFLQRIVELESEKKNQYFCNNLRVLKRKLSNCILIKNKRISTFLF